MDWHRIIRTACCILSTGALIVIAQAQFIPEKNTRDILLGSPSISEKLDELVRTQQELIKINQAQAVAIAIQSDKELAAVVRTLRMRGYKLNNILESSYDFDLEKLKK